MFNISDISVSLSFNGFFLFIGIVLIALAVYYFYKNTIPEIDTKLKIFLSIVRFLALSVILFFIFEPLVHYKVKNEIKPKSLIFFDNSSSIVAKDSSQKRELLNTMYEQFKEKFNGDVDFLTFGKDVNKIETYGLKLNESNTDLQKVFKYVASINGNINSITIISDGIITEGANPINSAVKMGIPVNTIALGDTTTETDAYISKIFTNEYLYTKTSADVEITVNNNNLNNQPAKINLFEDGRMIGTKEIVLSPEGINKVSFNYIPTKTGDVKLTSSISGINNEKNKANNSFIKFIKVLDSKINVTIVSSLPTSDVSFIKSSLLQNENYNVKLIQQAGNNFITNSDYNKIIDSTDIFVLISFPSSNTQAELLNKIVSKIENGKPVLFVMSEGTDFNKLKLLENNLPFSVKSFSSSKIYVQAYVNDNNSALIGSNNPLFNDTWNNLPPVLRNSGEFLSKPESQILLKAKVANSITDMPLVLTKSLGKKRAVAILASEIWRWKLNSVKESETVFDGFLSETIKWLNIVAEQKQLRVKTAKQVYGNGETVEFIASAYDEAFNPLDNADIKIIAKSGNNEFETVTESLGNGLYQATLSIPQTGYFTFNASGNYKGKSIGTDKGKFSIGEIDLEKINLKQNRDLLLSLSGNTGGRFYESKNFNNLIDYLNIQLINADKVIYTDNEIKLWNLEVILLIIILIFALEWVIRKKSGLL